MMPGYRDYQSSGGRRLADTSFMASSHGQTNNEGKARTGRPQSQLLTGQSGGRSPCDHTHYPYSDDQKILMHSGHYHIEHRHPDHVT
ncbi:unnamed protein product, partial [Nesidiocoris tenuis]